MTNDIARRMDEHKSEAAEGFTASHNVKRLVYLEPHDSIEQAIAREKRVKRWRREWKINLIEDVNPDWRDLYFDINQ